MKGTCIPMINPKQEACDHQEPNHQRKDGNEVAEGLLDSSTNYCTYT